MSRDRVRGVAEVFCSPLWWCGVQGACPVPCFCSWHLFLLLALQKWQLGFLVFLYLFVHDLPQLHMHTVILVPYSFFVFCCLQKGLSRCEHCSKGSGVPACLTETVLVKKGMGHLVYSLGQITLSTFME